MISTSNRGISRGGGLGEANLQTWQRPGRADDQIPAMEYPPQSLRVLA